MTEPVSRVNVLAKIDLANTHLDDTYALGDPKALVDATRALTQAQLATAYATLLVAEELHEANARNRLATGIE